LNNFLFTVDNEFDQRILILQLQDFCTNVEFAKAFLKCQLTLDDFSIKDNWSQSGNKEFEYLAYMKEDPTVEGKAVMIKYENGQDMISPNNINAEFQKQMYVVASIPIINELKRTFDKAFENQKLDLKYYKNAAKDKYKTFQKEAERSAREMIEAEKNASTHTNINLSGKFNAPVVVIPENIFDPKTTIIEFHLGSATVMSDLMPFQKNTDYKKFSTEHNLYDVYSLVFSGLCLKIIDPKLNREQNLINDITS